MIGSGIFLVPNLVARQLYSPAAIVLMWVLTGILSFFGALAYAELGSTIPATGGQYVYLREIYGSLWAFLSSWALFFTDLTASVAWLAINFANYLSYFIPYSPWTGKLVALGMIAAITAVNYRGVTLGAGVQKALTFCKLAGLAILIAGAFLHPAHGPASPPAAGFSIGHFGAAMIFGLLGYDGWLALSFVAGEVRNPQRNIALALAVGVGIVMAVYVLANLAYLRVLTIPEIAAAPRVGQLAAERSLGAAGASLISLTVLLSIAGSANGWLMTSPRIYFAQARDGLFLKAFGAIHPRFQTPHFAILLFGVWSAFLAVSGSYETLISYAMLPAWIFYGLTAAGVFVLRRKYPNRMRPFAMPGYPVTLVLFLLVAVAFIADTFAATPGPALISALIILSGVPVYYFWKRNP